MKKAQVFQYAGGIVLAGAGLYIFFRDVDPAQLWAYLRATPLAAVLGGVGLTLLTLFLRTIRWNLILPPTAGASRRGLFGIVMVGFMVNNFLPARLGEATRVLLLWRRNRFSLPQSVGSVLLERAIDSVMFLSFFFIPALLLPALRPVAPYALPAAAAAAGALCALLFYMAAPLRTKSFLKWCLKWTPPKIRQRFLVIGKDLVSNLHWLFNPGTFVLMTLLSFATIACYAAMMVLFIQETSFGPLAGMFTAACAALGAAIPLSPGYVGTLHAALKQGFMLCGIETTKAIAVATIYHAVGYVTVSVLGLWYFFRMGISFKDISKAKDVVEKKGTET
ncbi:MAG: flippase-like domain-containing protein [Chitinispirillaceae bacterium]|nr:flippase-like domain-containing protein [Chitinispirillaceae bacterium]